MSKSWNVTPENYKQAYNKIYSFLRHKHPEILKEYRKLLEDGKKSADALVMLAGENQQ